MLEDQPAKCPQRVTVDDGMFRKVHGAAHGAVEHPARQLNEHSVGWRFR